MANLKEQKLRKLKRSNLSGSLIGFIVIGLIVFVSFAVMLEVFGLYITDSKLSSEVERVLGIAKIYQLSAADKTSKTDQVLDEAEAYLILDDKGNVVKVNGENTCDLEGGRRIDILGLSRAIDEEGSADLLSHSIDHAELAKAILENAPVMYPDTGNAVITPDEDGHIQIDFLKLKDILMKERGDAALPFWIEVRLDDGTRMVCKAHFNVFFREIMTISALAVIILVLAVAMLIFIIVYLCKTIRNRKRMNEVFFMDEVTGKHNWLWFMVNAERLLKKRSNADNKYAILDIVFVNYRNFCVCHSVEEGERMLKIVDEVINRHLDQRKELAAHHSAAHFAAMLLYTDEEALKGRIRKIVDELEVINEDHKFSFWVGVDRIESLSDGKGAGSKRKNIDIEINYNNAGAARSTITGDDSAIALFDDKMVEEQRWIDRINENRQKALDNEEFIVYYQPKYDPRTNELRGAEALIRWKSPEDGMISPGRFIPIFEKNGFITEIDHYMLRHVATDQKKWLDKGYECVPVSVNVSRAHFIESDLAEQIRDIVDAAGTPRRLIEIELTESAFFDDKNALIYTIGKLKEYGFTVSMDDFGSGYSSLNSLKEMPLDVLKLDAEFFRSGDTDDRGRIVVAEAIKLAKNLNMKTVAEGVEIKEQVDFLANEGCDMIQGFYFARPMPGDEYEEKMAENAKNV